MKQPSEHLTWEELACKDGTPYPLEFRDSIYFLRLVVLFKKIRGIYDKPIVVVSAYRTPEWNKKIGGAVNSQHLLGRALDLQPPKGVTVDEFYKEIKWLEHSMFIGGIGKYKTFVHVDVRVSDKTVYWSGTGVKDS